MAHKHFLSKLLNTDDAPHLVDSSEVINVENMRLGNDGTWQNVKGTTRLYQAILGDEPLTDPPGCIGGCTDEPGRFIAWFVRTEGLTFTEEAGTNFDGDVYNQIHIFDKNTGFGYLILDSFDVKLNFSKEHLIQANIVNGTLYWNDNYNMPRMIHIGAAIKMVNAGVSPIPSEWTMEAPMSQWDIALVRVPYGLAPQISKENAPSQPVNKINDDSFKIAVQYIYWDGEKSVLSPWSRASLVNGKNDDTHNCINITLDTTEKIPQGVRFVRLVALNETTNKAFVFKQYDKLITTDATIIADHNSGFNPIFFTFYNNAFIESIGDAEMVQPFHSVPDLVKAQDVCKNRLFISNYQEGKDVPKKTSLTANFITSTTNGGGTSVLTVPIYGVKLRRRYKPTPVWPGYIHYYVKAYVVYLSDRSPSGWYVVKSTRVRSAQRTDYLAGSEGLDEATYAPAWPTVPSTILATDLEYIGDFITASTVKPCDPDNATIFPTNFYENIIVNLTSSTATIDGTGSSGELIESRNFKSGGDYQVGKVFFNRALNKCGVVTNEGLRVLVPERDFEFTDRTPFLQWHLDNTDAVNEIPDWAEYYSIVVTKNLKTRFFQQGFDKNPLYYRKDSSGAWLETGTAAYTDAFKDAEAIGFDLACFTQTGLGYTFNEGDVCIVYKSGSAPVYLTVLGVANGKVLVSPKDMGALGTGTALKFEIYSPYLATNSEFYCEMGEMCRVLNPGTPTRTYQKTEGQIEGDTHIILRNFNNTQYVAEAMAPNDRFWKRWNTNHGRGTFVTTKGAARNKTGIRFSNTFIPGTDTNGLSAFEALNQDQLPIELGETMKLILTSKAQSEGSVMLGIGRSEYCSIYIGEAELMDAKGNKTLIKTDGVIGQVNLMRGSSGTLHPESVAMVDGRVFWIDILKKEISSHAGNGHFAVSDYKMRRVTKALCERLMKKMDDGDIVHIPAGIDPHNMEYLFSVPQTESAPPMGTLTDYTPAKDFPYDFYDGKAKTWIYNIEKDKFGGSFIWTAEYFMSLGAGLFTIKSGDLWEHNSSVTFDSVYGLTTKPRIALVENGEPDSKVKLFTNLVLEANMIPSWTHIRTEMPYVQSSDLVIGDWTTLNGNHYAAILRDRLSPNTPGDADRKLYYGDEMRGQWAKILMEFVTSGQPLQLRFINVGYDVESNQENL